MDEEEQITWGKYLADCFEQGLQPDLSDYDVWKGEQE